ncbi:hypothetical protein ScPMuIL_006482 [Solemya velum]
MAEGWEEDNSENTTGNTNRSHKTDLDTFKKDVSRVKNVLRRLSTLPDELFEEHTQDGSLIRENTAIDISHKLRIHTALSRLNSFVDADDSILGATVASDNAGHLSTSPPDDPDRHVEKEEDLQSIPWLSSALLKQLEDVDDEISDAILENSVRRKSTDVDIPSESIERIVNQEDVEEIVTRLCEIADEFNEKYTPSKLMFFRPLVRMTWLFFYVSMKSVHHIENVLHRHCTCLITCHSRTHCLKDLIPHIGP